VGAHPVDSSRSAAAAHGAATSRGDAERSACASALQRARASKTLPSEQAVAANTAMLRACRTG
jgi:hypothetical protein